MSVVLRLIFLFALFPLTLSSCAISEGRVFPQCRKVQPAEAQARARLAHPDLPSIPEIADKAASPNAQKEMQTTLDDFMYRWFYGQGLGATSLNVGTVVLFPPYALYLLLNAGLGLSGYEPIQPLSYVPGEPGDYVRASYDAITGVPGRATAGIAGEPFQGEDPCIP